MMTMTVCRRQVRQYANAWQGNITPNGRTISHRRLPSAHLWLCFVAAKTQLNTKRRFGASQLARPSEVFPCGLRRQSNQILSWAAMPQGGKREKQKKKEKTRKKKKERSFPPLPCEANLALFLLQRYPQLKVSFLIFQNFQAGSLRKTGSS